MHVVARVERDNGVGGMNRTRDRDQDAWMHHRGRGFLGFGEITEEEDFPGTPVERANNLLRDHSASTATSRSPGSTAEQTQMLASDPLLAQPLARTGATRGTPSCRIPAGQRARICFPYLELERKETRELAPARAVLGTVETVRPL